MANTKSIYRIFISLLVILNLVFAATGAYFYFTGKDQSKLRASLESLVDRLADELVVVHGRLSDARVEIDETRAELDIARDQTLLLEQKLVERDDKIRHMKYELAQLRLQIERVDLGDVIVGNTVAQMPKKAELPIAQQVPSPESLVSRTTSAPKYNSDPLYLSSSRVTAEPTQQILRINERVVEPVATPNKKSSGVLSMASKPNKTVPRGTVLAVNSEFNFVIISLGAEHGVKEGTLLMMAREGITPNNLRVDMVDETTCAATIISGDQGAIQIGDPVSFQVS